MNKIFLRIFGGIMTSVILTSNVYLSEAVIPSEMIAKVIGTVTTVAETSAKKSTQAEKSKKTLPTEEVTLYVDKDKYFALETEEVIKWISSDENILTIDVNGLAHPIKEGRVTITAECNSYLKKYYVTITTFNNGKDVKKYSAVEPLTFHNGDLEIVTNNINTITDLVQYLIDGMFYYNPYFPVIAMNKFTWAADAEFVLETRQGVCCDIANLAHYLLKDDFEKAGFILETGTEYGHIYNYFFEDGYYYVFDSTLVISDRAYSSEMNSIEFYQNQIYKVKTLEEFGKERIHSFPDRDTLCMSMIAIDASDYDECPPYLLSYMDGSWRKADENYKYTVGFEEIINVKEIWVNPNWKNYKLIKIKTEELPDGIPSMNEEYNKQRSLFQY